MKYQIAVSICFISSLFVHGQKVSVRVDEMTTHHLRQLSEEQRIHFDSILQSRIKTNWEARIDELAYDYAFVEEEFCEKAHLMTTAEYYFNQGDSIPVFLYHDGKTVDPKQRYSFPFTWYYQHAIHFQTFQPLLDNYSKFQPVQELAYSKEQILDYSCIGSSKNQEKTFEEKRTAELKTTYSINTMIDKKSGNILVSLQYAPGKPKFEIQGYSSAWDW